MTHDTPHDAQRRGNAVQRPMTTKTTPCHTSAGKPDAEASRPSEAAVANPDCRDDDGNPSTYSRFELMRLNPFREPSWCWKAAGKPIDVKNEASASPFIQKVRAYRDALAKACDKDAIEKVRRRYPLIAQVHDIHAGNDPLKWELEARLLADEPYDQIALKAGLPVEVVECYEAVFFNVSDLQGLDWRLVEIIRADLVNNAPSESSVWMYMGLAGGPIAVDLLTADYLCRPTPKIPNRHQLAEQARLLALFYLTVSRNREQLKVLAAEAEVLFSPDQAGLSRSDARRRAECLRLLNMAAANFEDGEANADWTSELLNELKQKMKDAATSGKHDSANNTEDMSKWMKM